MTIDTAPTLTDELRAIERKHPGWHLYVSDAGNIWAVTTQAHDLGGSGTTLGEVRTPAAMEREIAVQERIWGLQAPCWADPLTRAERRQLADMLARWCRRFYHAAEPQAVSRRAHGAEITHLRCRLMNCSTEMGSLRIDVTEGAEVAA